MKKAISIFLFLVLVGCGETITLPADEWECTVTEKRTQLQPMLVGKVTMLTPITRHICMEYTRKGRP